MFTRSRILSGGALLASAALVLAGCAGGGPDPGEGSSLDGAGLGTDAEIAAFEELYRASLEADESQVVIYGTNEPDAVMAAFEARFPGIDVIHQDIVGAERDAKLAAEKSSGNRVGDIATDGREPIGFLASTGACASLDPIPAIPEEWIEFDSTAFGRGVSVFGIVYNTEMVDESEVPTSWEELLDPKWKGKITAVDPTLAGRLTVATFGQMLVPESNAQALGMPFLERLKAQELNTVAADPLMVQAVATGETPLAILVYLPIYLTAAASGAPIGFSFPLESNNQWTQSSMCMLEGAPNPHAAELYINWTFSQEGQSVRSDAGVFPVMPGIDSPLGLPPVDEIDLLEKLPTLEALTGYVEAEKQVVELFSR